MRLDLENPSLAISSPISAVMLLEQEHVKGDPNNNDV